MKKLSWLMRPNRPGLGRSACAAAGIAVAAALYYLGYAPAEPTMLSGIAFAALGAAVGLLLFGVFDIIRKIL